MEDPGAGGVPCRGQVWEQGSLDTTSRFQPSQNYVLDLKRILLLRKYVLQMSVVSRNLFTSNLLGFAAVQAPATFSGP